MGQPTRSPSDAGFRLDRFEWAAPDRLEVEGEFRGMEAPDGEPILAVHAADGPRRLAGMPNGRDGVWGAAFIWREMPVAFDAAELELGDGLVVKLPAPGSGVADGQELELGAAGQPASDEAPELASSDAMRLQAQVLTLEQELRASQAARESLEQDLARARADLEAERVRHDADGERFREGLAQVQAIGEQALADAEAGATALRARLAEYEEEAAAAAELRRALEHARAERDRLGADLDQARQENEATDRLRTRLEAVRAALDAGG